MAGLVNEDQRNSDVQYILTRMAYEGLLPVGLLDFQISSIFANPKDLVVVLSLAHLQQFLCIR